MDYLNTGQFLASFLWQLFLDGNVKQKNSIASLYLEPEVSVSFYLLAFEKLVDWEV